MEVHADIDGVKEQAEKEEQREELRRRSSVVDEFEDEIRRSVRTLDIKLRDPNNNKDL